MFSFFSCNNKSKPDKQHKTTIEITNETVKLRFFEEIDLSNARDYEVDIKLNDNDVSIDLNFEGDKIDPKTLIGIQNILANLEDFEKSLRKQIRENYDHNGIAKGYIDFHIEELDPKELKDYLKTSDPNLSVPLQLLSKTKLNRIGFYPEYPTFYAIFDYRVSSELSDDILVVWVNENGEIEKMGIES